MVREYDGTHPLKPPPPAARPSRNSAEPWAPCATTARPADLTPQPGFDDLDDLVASVDGQPVQRCGFRILLKARSQNDPTVAGDAGNSSEAVRMTDRLHPDVVLMGTCISDLEGIEVTRDSPAEILAEEPSHGPHRTQTGNPPDISQAGRK